MKCQLTPASPSAGIGTSTLLCNTVTVYRVNANSARTLRNLIGALLDRGANGCVIGPNMRVGYRTTRYIDLIGLRDHTVQELITLQIAPQPCYISMLLAVDIFIVLRLLLVSLPSFDSSCVTFLLPSLPTFGLTLPQGFPTPSDCFGNYVTRQTPQLISRAYTFRVPPGNTSQASFSPHIFRYHPGAIFRVFFRW